MSAAGNITSVLILRSDPQDRVSKDGGIHSACGHPSRLAALAPEDEV